MSAEAFIELAERLKPIEAEVERLEARTADLERDLLAIKQELAVAQGKKTSIIAEIRALADELEVPLRELDALEAGLVALLRKPIDELKLTVHTANILKVENLYFIGHVVERTETELLKTPNMLKKNLLELEDKLALKGLRLGMKLPKDWQGVTFKANDSDAPDTTDISLLKTSIDELGLTTRTAKCLKAEEMDWIGDVIENDEDDFLNDLTNGIGKKSIGELKDKLIQYDPRLRLGMKLPKDWRKLAVVL
jgi:DNA-directed RNA polymerase alpha subunit